MSNDRIVVAGGLGFVGRALIADLKSQGHTNIRSVSRNINPLTPWQKFHEPHIETRDGVEYMSADLSDERQALGALRDARYVYHLAAPCVGGIDYIKKHRSDSILGSKINLNLLQACEKVGVAKFFLASSACVYSDNEFAIRESFAYPASAEKGYGESKMFDEQSCAAFREERGVDTRVGRYFGVYGPGDAKRHNHVIGGLCKKIAAAKLLAHSSIEVLGDGSQRRGFLYIDDCVLGTQKLFNSGCVEPLNLGSVEVVTINQVIDILNGISGTKFDRIYNTQVLTGVKCRFSNNEKIRKELGWEPTTDLKTGLEHTYRWWYDKLMKELK